MTLRRSRVGCLLLAASVWGGGIASAQSFEADVAPLVETSCLQCHGARTVTSGTLLDQTTVLFGSNLGNANSHTPDDLPILVAGGGLSHGEHIVHEGPNVPLSNLFLTLLQHQGVETDTFGQSAGTLSWS
mgnify:CR=1 FL=1